MFGGKAVGWMAGTSVWMPGAGCTPGKRTLSHAMAGTMAPLVSSHGAYSKVFDPRRWGTLPTHCEAHPPPDALLRGFL